MPIGLRVPCPCVHEFTLRDGVWTGDDGSLWEPSFFGDKLTLTDRMGSFTVRWKFDPWLEEVTFLDVDAGGGDEETDLTTSSPSSRSTARIRSEAEVGSAVDGQLGEEACSAFSPVLDRQPAAGRLDPLT